MILKGLERKMLLAGLILLLGGLAVLFACQENQLRAVPFYVSIDTEDASEQIMPWEDEEGNYYIFLPGYAELSNVQIKLNTSKTVLLDGEKLADGMCCEAIQTDKAYELVVAKEKYARQVTFVQSANVATMYIDTASGSMNYIHAEKGNEEQGKIRLYTVDGQLNYHGEITLGGRGNSTWDISDKKPYNMKLQSAGDLLNMGKAQNWVLLANVYDSSNIRNKMVYEFAKEMDLPFSPDSEWVELFINDKYEGLYLLCERNEVHAERVAISEQGSFLISAERESRLDDKQYVLTNAKQALRIHYADDSVDVLEKMQTVENALLANDGIDIKTGKKWADLIDVNSWARKYLIEEFFANTDGGAISQFYYLNGLDDDGKIYAGPVWDYDASSGAEVTWQIPLTDIFYANRPRVRVGEEIPWFYSLYQKEEFRNYVVEIFETEFLPVIQVLLDETINEYENCIMYAARRDAMRWDKKDDLEGSIQDLKIFLMERQEFLSDLWLQGKEYCLVSVFPEDVTHHDVYYPVERGGMLPELPVLEDTERQIFLGWYYVENDEPFDGTRPIIDDIEIYAKWEDSRQKREEQITKLMPLAIIACMGVGILIADIRRGRKGG